MRMVPHRSAWTHVGTILAAFAAAPALGFLLGARVAPDSLVISTIAPFAYFLIFFLGILIWVGFGVVALIFTLLRAFVTRSGRKLPSLSEGLLVPPGYRVFPVLGGLIGGGLGILAALLTPGSLVTAGGPFLLAGIAYGGALWLAAHHGYLPFPDDE